MIIDLSNRNLKSFPTFTVYSNNKKRSPYNNKNHIDFVKGVKYTVYLNNNHITSIPDNLPACIEELNVSSNKITSIPKLPVTMKTLYINDNLLTEFPGNFHECGLETFIGKNNSIQKLPKSVPLSLKHLVLSHNDLINPNKLSESILSNNRLEIIQLDHNKLTEIPNIFTTHATFIYLGHNNISKTIPLNENIRLLDLSCNRFRVFPEYLPRFLSNLYLSNNNIEYLTNDISIPLNLRQLNLADNNIQDVNTGVIFPRMLENINLSGNNLTQIPKHLPTHIRVLSLSNNHIQEIHGVSKLAHLECLYLNNNDISKLSTNFNERLTFLQLNNNKIHYLPDDIPTHINMIALHDNPIAYDYIRPDVIIQYPMHTLLFTDKEVLFKHKKQLALILKPKYFEGGLSNMIASYM